MAAQAVPEAKADGLNAVRFGALDEAAGEDGRDLDPLANSLSCNEACNLSPCNSNCGCNTVTGCGGC